MTNDLYTIYQKNYRPWDALDPKINADIIDALYENEEADKDCAKALGINVDSAELAQIKGEPF